MTTFSDVHPGPASRARVPTPSACHRRIWYRSACSLVTFILVIQANAASVHSDAAAYETTAKPFLQQYCMDCHGDKKQKAGVSFSSIDTDIVRGKSSLVWRDVLDVLNAEDMPPEKASQPSASERQGFIDFLTGELDKAKRYVDQQSAGSVRRLTRAEHVRSLTDTLGLPRLTGGFPLDKLEDRLLIDAPTHGFDKVGDALVVSPLHVEQHVALADKLLSWAMDVHPTERWLVDFGPPKGAPKSDGTYARFAKHVNRSTDPQPRSRYFELPPSVSKKAAGDPHGIRLKKATGDGPDAYQVMLEGEALRIGYRPFTLFNSRSKSKNGPVIRAGVYRVYWRARSLAGAQHLRVQAAMPISTRKSARIVLSNSDQVVGETWQEGELSFFADDASRLFVDMQVVAKAKEQDSPPLPVAIDHVAISGPHYDADTRQALFGPNDADKLPDRQVEQLIEHFVTRAYRRPPSASEVSDHLHFYKTRKQNDTHRDALRATYLGIMVNPRFLFLLEPNSDGRSRELDDFELAARLSYFFWSAPPDSELMALAQAGKLKQGTILEEQVDRMIADPKSEAFATSFARQWLHLDRVMSVAPDEEIYGKAFSMNNNKSRPMQVLFIDETMLFFKEIFYKDLSILNFIDSDFTFLNKTLAKHYGLGYSGLGGRLVRYQLKPEDHRGGILTHGSILLQTSNSTRTSPVYRGVYILENILGDPPPPPPPNAGEIANTVPGEDEVTVRERLEIHRRVPSCAACHNKIDPLGFALENYDVIGRWRTDERSGNSRDRTLKIGGKIDPSGVLPDGTRFADLRELKQIILREPDAFLRCYAEKMFVYALGRLPDLGEEEEIDRLRDVLATNGYRTRALLKALVTSKAFKTR